MADAIAFSKSIFGNALGYVRQDLPFFSAAVAFFVLLSVAIDQITTGSAANFANAVAGLVFLYLQLLVTFRALDSVGAAPAGYARRHLTEGRFGSAWWASILVTLAVLVGLILLVIPGIVLLLLWSMIVPAIAAERLGATDALRRSWQLARPVLGKLAMIAGCFLLIVSLAAILLFVVIAIWPDDNVASVVTNVLLYPIFMFSVVVWTFVFLKLRAYDADQAISS